MNRLWLILGTIVVIFYLLMMELDGPILERSRIK